MPGMFDEGHTWIQVSQLGRADVGVDSFAQRLIGRVDAVDLPEVGKEMRRGDVLFALRQGDHRAAFAAPVDGVVSAVDKQSPLSYSSPTFTGGFSKGLTAPVVDCMERG